MLAYLFVLLTIAVRFLPFAGRLSVFPHAWHFTPLAASLLFFGARGARRQMWVPVVLLAATDVVLTKFIYAYPFSWDQIVTWGWYAAILWLGTGLSEKASFVRVLPHSSSLRFPGCWIAPATITLVPRKACGLSLLMIGPARLRIPVTGVPCACLSVFRETGRGF